MTGLLQEQDWRHAAAAKARALFSNEAVSPAAVLLSQTHPWAFDYIEQAPVLVLAAFSGSTRWREFKAISVHVCSVFHSHCANKRSLREVMAHYRIPYQARVLKPYVVTPARWPAVSFLKMCEPSSLAQAIPQKAGEQGKWLRAVSNFVEAFASAPHMLTEERIAWAVSRFGQAPAAAVRQAKPLADLMTHGDVDFDLRWSFDEAEAAMERWHERLARKKDAVAFARQFGVSFEEEIEDLGSHKSFDVGKFEFVTLNSGMDIFKEGMAMRHCVFSYTGGVVMGKLRLFSIRVGGKRAATLELDWDEKLNRYRNAQLRGPANAVKLSRDLQEAVSEFVGRYNSIFGAHK